MSTFTDKEIQSEVYRWRQQDQQDRIMVKIFYQNFNLRDAQNRGLDKIQKNDEDVDAVSLKTLFEDKHYFPAGATVECRALGTFKNLEQNLKSMDTSKYEPYDCFFFVFLTFSEPDGRLHFNDKQPPECFVHLEKIVNVVKDIRVTQGKPKIFLIQSDDMDLMKPKQYPKGPPEKVFVKIPTDVDRLIIQSSIPQKIITGVVRKESFLIQAFVDVITNNIKSDRKEDLLSLTIKINEKVSALIESIPSPPQPLPVPLVTSTLTKLLNLHES